MIGSRFLTLQNLKTKSSCYSTLNCQRVLKQTRNYVSINRMGAISLNSSDRFRPKVSRQFHTSFSVSGGKKKTVPTPVFPESISEGDVRWTVAVGDSVAVDSVIGEIETDKTTIPVVSPFSGVITKLFFADGDKVSNGQELCELESFGEQASKSSTGTTSVTSKVDATPVPVKTPVFPESITEGDIRITTKIGDVVSVDDVIGEIETDKTTIEIRSPVSGTISSFNFADGDRVTVDSIVATIVPGQSSGAKQTSSDAAKSKTPVVDSPASKPSAGTADKPATSVSFSTPSNVISDAGAISSGFERIQTRVKMTRIRQTIAQRLKTAQNTSAMLTTFNEVDMSNLMELRKRYQDQFVKKHAIKLGFMSAFLAASAHALQAIPSVNAFIDGNEIVYHNYVDISVAVATPKGLVVPVLKNVHSMDFADIEKSLVAISEKAKSNKLAIEDMEGGTFTVSNGGVFGSLMGTPIINPPQSAILGMHAINERPIAVSGQVVVRPMMYIALTYDHRIIDGKEAVTFLKKIKEAIEDPRVLLLGL